MQNDPIRSSPAGAAAQPDGPVIEVADAAAGGERREQAAAAEFGGPPGPEPTRFGDWEKNGRCIDF